MKNLNKKFIFGFGLLTAFLVPNLLLAQSALDRINKVKDLAGLPSTEADPQRIIANIVAMALGFVGIFFLASLVWAGWQWMSSGGSEDKISKAKDRLKNSLIGIVIVVMAMALTVWLSNIVYKATCNPGDAYCPVPYHQPSGACNTDSDCEITDYKCNIYGSCLYDSCDSDSYCQNTFGPEYHCPDFHCVIQ